MYRIHNALVTTGTIVTRADLAQPSLSADWDVPTFLGRAPLG